jgi:hypothetical protein
VLVAAAAQRVAVMIVARIVARIERGHADSYR